MDGEVGGGEGQVPGVGTASGARKAVGGGEGGTEVGGAMGRG